MRVRDPRDTLAWQEFHDIYAPIVRSYCRQRRIQSADVEDIVQDVMTSVAKAIQGFEYQPAIGKFRSWLGTITVNRIHTVLSKRSRQREEVSEQGTQDFTADPDSNWVSIFSDRILSVACSRIRSDFAETTWHCFEMTWLENKPALETAKLLQIPVHAVYVNKSRVLKRLEAEIRSLADDVAVPPRSS